MCGIYGFSTKHSDIEKEEILKQMSRTLRHRGPDQTGKYQDNIITMGVERLSILDIDKGHQPIFSNDGNFVIIHNGEIYNYREIREKLKKMGYHFQTNTDTEVIVNLYQHKGLDCLSDLNGMFAFAIYNISNQILFIARDRFGIKPLFYTFTKSELIFSSELKGLLAHSHVNPTVSADAIDLYLTMEFVPAPFTIYKEIKKLEQGSYLLWSNKSLQRKKWYEYSRRPNIYLKSEGEYVEKLDHLISKSIKLRTRSDVPLGSFLSGGLDSSLITYYLSRSVDIPLKTFNIAFEDSSFDESGYSNIVAKYLTTDHNSEVFSSRKMLEILPSVWGMMDEPFADASLLPTFLLSYFTSSHVTVALSGDGGDEVFAGYPTYFAHKLANRIPNWISPFLASISNRLPISFDNISFDFKVKQFCKGLGHKPAVRHQYWLGSFDNDEKMQGYTNGFNDQLNGHKNLENILENHMPENVSSIDWESHLYQDMRFYLQDDMLVKVDRTSMANSLEVRVPYLDHHIVEFMASVPSEWKYRLATSKYLLKSLGKKYLPENIVNRPKKGFGIPIANWFCTSLKDPLEEIVQNPNSFINSVFEKKYTSSLMKSHLDRKKDNRKLLWTLFVLENWHRNQSHIVN